MVRTSGGDTRPIHLTLKKVGHRILLYPKVLVNTRRVRIESIMHGLGELTRARNRIPQRRPIINRRPSRFGLFALDKSAYDRLPTTS